MKSAYEIGSAPSGSRLYAKTRKSSSRGERLRPQREHHLSSLSPGMKRGLRILLLEGGAHRESKFWRTAKGTGIPFETVLALYDRYLVRVVVESRDRNRTRQTATITETGTLVAERLLISEGEMISPEAMRLIGSLTDNFEDSPTVYANEREEEVL